MKSKHPRRVPEFEVDLEIVWQTVQQDLPVLRKRIGELLKHASKA